jgi:zinc D-Ala-D-Ala carboxypeptidase
MFDFVLLMIDTVLKWIRSLGIMDWFVKTERIDPRQVTYPDDISETDRYFVGIEINEKEKNGTIYHDRPLEEDDVVHELLHVKHPEKDEDWINNETEKQIDMMISSYVSYNEVVYSQTAIRNDIENSPNIPQLANIREAAEELFDVLRDWVGGPVKINSCFRSEELNKRIGGAKSSQHLANNGAAFDIDDTYGHKTNAQMFRYIKDNLEFDQLIWEFGDDKNPDWVHMSYKSEGNRKQILKALKVDGKTKYINIT